MSQEIAIITGACGGMGLACSRRIGRRYRLVLADRDHLTLKAERLELERIGIDVAAVVAADIASPGAAEALADTASANGALTALIHTAGVSQSMADWRTVFDVNLVATERLSRAVLDRAATGIVSVMITSIASVLAPRNSPEIVALIDDPLSSGFLDKLAPFAEKSIQRKINPSQFAYSFSKYGVARHVARMAHRYAEKNGRIVALAPGVIDTPMGRLETGENRAGLEFVRTQPIKRFGRAEEIASVADFLISEGASFVTGTEWVVDGGALVAPTPRDFQ